MMDRDTVEVNKSTIEPGIALQAALAEYNALRQEIQNRSGYQQNLLQLHVTTMTILIGAALSQQWGVWVLLVIPIESSILGLWWTHHALSITDIGFYIRSSIERRVSGIAGNPNAMGWENACRAGISTAPHKRVVFSFRRLLFVTFTLPAAGSLLIGVFLIITSNETVNSYYSALLGKPLPAPFASDKWWGALLILAIDLLLFAGLQSLMHHRTTTSKIRTVKAAQPSSVSYAK